MKGPGSRKPAAAPASAAAGAVHFLKLCADELRARPLPLLPFFPQLRKEDGLPPVLSLEVLLLTLFPLPPPRPRPQVFLSFASSDLENNLV